MKKSKIGHILLGLLLIGLTVFFIWLFGSDTGKQMGVSLLITVILLILSDVAIVILQQKRKLYIKIVTGVITGLLNLVILACVGIYGFAPTQLFYYHFDEESHAYMQTVDFAEEIEIDTVNGRAYGWMLHNTDDDAPMLLYFGGNGENACTHMRRMIEDNDLALFNDYNIVFIDYPGYGKSEGKCTDQTLRQYGLDVYDYISSREDVDKDQIIVWGYSIGTGVSNYVASKRDVQGLILMAPYSSGYDIYNGYVNIFYGPVKLLVSYVMPAEEFARDIKVKPLVLASKDDEVIRYWTSEKLASCYPDGCDLVTYVGTNHNSFLGNCSTYELIRQYLCEVGNREKSDSIHITENESYLKHILSATGTETVLDDTIAVYDPDDIDALRTYESYITEGGLLRELIVTVPTVLGDRMDIENYYKGIQSGDIDTYLSEYCDTLLRAGKTLDKAECIRLQTALLSDTQYTVALNKICEILIHEYCVYHDEVWPDVRSQLK